MRVFVTGGTGFVGKPTVAKAEAPSLGTPPADGVSTTLERLHARVSCPEVTITGHISTERGEPMAELYCPCPGRHKLWGEFWWVEGKHQWVFFDDLETSETYAERVERCPTCGRRLERKDLLET